MRRIHKISWPELDVSLARLEPQKRAYLQALEHQAVRRKKWDGFDYAAAIAAVIMWGGIVLFVVKGWLP